MNKVVLTNMRYEEIIPNHYSSKLAIKLFPHLRLYAMRRMGRKAMLIQVVHDLDGCPFTYTRIAPSGMQAKPCRTPIDDVLVHIREHKDSDCYARSLWYHGVNELI